MRKKLLTLCTVLLMATLMVGCSSKTPQTNDTPKAEQTTIKIGVTGGPHETVMTKVAELAAKEGLTVEVVSFSDYIQPNVQLDEGQLDMNAMQHAPFLENAIKDKGLKLANVGTNILIPMCILSEDHTKLGDIPDGSLIGIPNDTTNMARALLLLQTADLIQIDPEAGVMATTSDITSNPHNFTFQELEAGMLLRALPEFGMAVVNSNYVVEAGMVPNEEALFVEKTEDNPWVNIFAVRQGEEKNPAYLKLMSIYQSDGVKTFIDETYKGAVLAAW